MNCFFSISLFLFSLIISINITCKKRYIQYDNSRNNNNLDYLEIRYQDLINPNKKKYLSIKANIYNVKKPERIIIDNNEDNNILKGNSRISKEDYEYSGALGLGSGVIAIILFVFVGVSICIYGSATEYYL